MVDLWHSTFGKNPLRDENMTLKLDFRDTIELNKFLSSGIQKIYFIQTCDSRLEIFRLLNIFKRLENNGFNSDYLGPDNASLLNWDALKLTLDQTSHHTVRKTRRTHFENYLVPQNAPDWNTLKQTFEGSDLTLKSLTIIDAQDFKKQDDCFKLTLKRLFMVLSNAKSKKAIVVCSTDHFCFNCVDFQQKVQYSSDFSVVKSVDKIGFEDLTEDSQRSFLDLIAVFFQETPVSLEQFILIFNGEIGNVISAQVLTDIVFDPTIPNSLIKIGNSTQSNEEIDFFKLRTFYSKFLISKQVKKLLANNLVSDMFIFSNIKSVEYLAEVLDLKGKNKKRILQNKDVLTFESLEEALSFYNNAKCFSLHLISYDSNYKEFNWISSKNSIKKIYNYIVRNYKTALTLKDLIDYKRLNKTIILYGLSGSGKTYILSKIQSLVPTSWVIYVDLVRYKREILKIQKDIDRNNVVQFLSLCIEPYNILIAGLLNQYLFHNSDLSVYILFDSFDHIARQVNSACYKNMLNFFCFLKDQSRACIWIASCFDEYTKNLENALCEFRTTFATYQVNDYIKEVYQSSKNTIRHCITGLPLAFKMLSNDCIDISKYVEQKINIYMDTYFPKSNFKEDIVKYLYAIHGLVATKVVYPKLTLLLGRHKDNFHVNISNVGFVSDTTNLYSENNYRFENLIFAEFFIAIATFYKWMTDPQRCSMEQFLVFDIFLKPEYKNIRFLLNSYIQNNPIPPAPEVVSNRLSQMWNESKPKFFNSQGKCALHVLIEEDLDLLAKWFCEGEFFNTILPLILSTNNLHKKLQKYNWAPRFKIEPSSHQHLFNFIKKNQINDVKLLYNSESVRSINLSALHLAASLGFEEITEFLIGCNIPVDILDNRGRTSLHHAFIYNHMKIVNLLMARKANLMAVNKQIKKAICHCAENNYVEQVTILINNSLEDVYHTDRHGMSPLIYAAKSKNLDMAILLINKRADINHIDDYGISALCWAVLVGDVQMADLLMGAGADHTIKLEDGSNILHIAVKQKSFNMVKYLTFCSIDFNTPNFHGITPLELATRLNYWDIVNHLVLEGALILTDSFNPITIAVAKCQWQLVSLLLSRGCSLLEVCNEKKLEVLKQVNCTTPKELMELGSTELLDLFLQTRGVTEPTELDHFMSEPYEELRLQGVLLPKNIKSFIEEKLVEIRSTIGQTFRLSSKGTEERKSLVLDQISILMDTYLSAEVDSEFIARAMCIAQNIELLKRGRRKKGKGKEEKENSEIPWEQMEFCVIVFINMFINPRDDDFEFRLILDQKRLLMHLNCFSKMLRSQSDKELMQDEERLEADYRILRDIYSLQRISDYIKLAISLDTNDEISIFALMRTLQVVGEYLKNTEDSMNLSPEILNYLMLFAPINIQNILTTLRDSLVHTSKSKIDIETTLKCNRDYFDSILNELRKVRLQIDFLLYKKKSESLKIFRQKCAGDEDLELVNRYIHWNARSEITKEDYEIRDLQDIKVLINTLKQAMQQPSTNELRFLDQLSAEMKKVDKIIYENLNKTKNKYLEYRALYQNIKSVQFSYMKDLYHITSCNAQREGIYNNAANIVINLLKLMQAKSDGSRDNAIKTCSQLIHMMKWGFHKLHTIQDINDNLSTNDELIENSLEEVFNQIITYLEVDNIKEMLTNHLENNKLSHKNLCDLKKCHTDVVEIIDNLNITEKDKTNLKQKVINPTVFNTFLDKNRPLADLGNLETTHAKLLWMVENLNLTTMEKREFKKKTFRDVVGNLDKYAKLVKNFQNEKFHQTLVEFCSTLNNDLIDSAVRNYIQGKECSFKNEFFDKFKLLSKIVKENKTDVRINPIYQAAIEILLLDIMTALITKQGIIEYDLSYDENAPLLVGKALRNYLAHGTPLIDIMPYEPIHAILSTIRVIERDCKNVFKKAPDPKMYLNDRLLSHFQKILALNGQSNNNFFKCKNSNFTKFKLGHLSKPLYLDYVQSAELKDLDNIEYISSGIMGATKFNNSILIWPALIVAAKNGHFNIVKSFFENIENIKVANYINYDSFKKAADYLERYSIKLNSWSIFDENNKKISACSNEFYLNAALREAVKGGHCDIVKLLSQGCKSINFFDSMHNTLLHHAAEKGNEEVIEALLGHKVNIEAVTKKLMTPLHVAALKGHNVLVEILLINGANVNAQDIDQLSALHYAADGGYDEVTKTLLNHAAVVDLKSSDGTTPLHLSVQSKHLNTTRLLLEHGADVNRANLGSTCLKIAAATGCEEIVKLLLKFNAIFEIEKDDFTPLHAAAYCGQHEVVKLILNERSELDVDHYFMGMLNSLQLAVIVGHIKTTQVLLDFGANVSSANKEGITAIHMACQYGQTKIVKLLLDSNQCEINAFSSLIATPLHLAASHGHHEIVEELLKSKADKNLKERKGLTPLHIAALHGHQNVVNILLKYGANIHEESNDQSRAIHYAASNGNCDIVKALIEHGAEVNVRTEILFTPLHFAVQNEHVEAASTLIDSQADVNALAIDNMTTPLGIAVQNGHAKMVTLLIEKGANTRFPKNFTPAIHTAIIHRRKEVIKVLLKLDPTYAEITSINGGHTPLYLAAGCNYLEAVDILLKYHVNINAATDNGTTALHYASQEGNEEIVARLIDHKADVRARSKLKYTPLHMAADTGRKRVVVMLLQNNANIEDKCFRGATALHCSAEEGHTEVVKILLDRNANINAAMEDGSTALHLASANDHKEVVKILLDYNADINIAKKVDLSTALHLSVENKRINIVRILLKRGARINNFRKNTEAGFETALDIAEKHNDENIIAVLKENAAKRIDQLITT